MTKTKMPEYRIYHGIKQRCYNKNRDSFKLYGGRGIEMCDRWLSDFRNFYQDMGKRPTDKHSIDRVDPNKGYSPDNCRWATAKEQAETKRVKIQTECLNCGDSDLGNMRKGLCHKCNEYKRRSGFDRPVCSDERDRLKREKQERAFKKTSKEVVKVCINSGQEISTYKSVNEAVRIYGMGVANVLRGRVQTCKGFKWKYSG